MELNTIELGEHALCVLAKSGHRQPGCLLNIWSDDVELWKSTPASAINYENDTAQFYFLSTLTFCRV